MEVVGVGAAASTLFGAIHPWALSQTAPCRAWATEEVAGGAVVAAGAAAG
jgi:hypothetical protein